MALSIQERLKDLRVERGLTLEQLAEQTHLSKSALGSYEAEDFKDISHYALIKLAKFYGVTADYLLGRSQTRNHPNADLADRRGNRQPGQRPGTGGYDVYLQAAQTELQEAVRGRKEVAEADCAEVRFTEKSKAPAGEKISGRQKQILQNGGYHEERR